MKVREKKKKKRELSGMWRHQVMYSRVLLTTVVWKIIKDVNTVSNNEKN